MGTLIQLFSIGVFLVATIYPLMWVWGHVLSIAIFLWGSVVARQTKRQKQIIEALSRGLNNE